MVRDAVKPVPVRRRRCARQPSSTFESSSTPSQRALLKDRREIAGNGREIGSRLERVRYLRSAGPFRPRDATLKGSRYGQLETALERDRPGQRCAGVGIVGAEEARSNGALEVIPERPILLR